MNEKEVKTENTWRPAHEAVEDMLEADPLNWAIPLAVLFGDKRAKVPPLGEIPILIESFEDAKERIAEKIDKAIGALKGQLEEGQKKKEEEKETE